MKRFALVLCAAGALAGFAIWQSFAQAEPLGAPAQANIGRFATATSDHATVLVDTSNGVSWTLRRDLNTGQDVWIPVKLVESEDDGIRWLELQRTQAAAKQKQSQNANDESGS